MSNNVVRSLLAEPRAPQPPQRVWRDWALIALLLPTAILEGVLREDVVWRPVAIVIAVGSILALLWRRTHPLAVSAVVFGVAIASSLASLIGDLPVIGLNTMIAVILLPYALLRWGSGREIGIGLGIYVVALVTGFAVEYTGLLNVFLGGVVLFFPASIGHAVRYWATSRARELDKMRLLERAQLARELHDTVAHHVSAIAIRAQAGRVVAAIDPSAAVEALTVIEAEASRTLAEMRVMVGNLREDEMAAMAPQQGVADLEQLARSVGDQPRVELELSGDLVDLQPAVGAAVYRIAQESITNAVRHARHVTRIDVRVAAEERCVRLTVCDDGDAGATVKNPSGYGLVGMSERAALLGGSFEAGPGPDRGWTVEAVLPKVGAAR
ncbi:sensor histidine kinase [Kribbella antibiotica]|uniref:histidine kinase n=1 Tax=Kribbella antibiotica TaxID=190195 RepID=A0A4R4ZZ51_9ACTN|nr:histidine kinase [Kribbella antibiotica]TDD63439.1 sensor histidine kinase [Kribbella antibiotica]